MNDIATADSAANELGFATASTHAEGALAVDQAKAISEVQAAMVIAKKFPRDMHQAMTRILESCRRPMLAEQALYTYPRGGQTVTGPSIRAAEVMQQNWCNIESGVRELVRGADSSLCEAYAWDIETNNRQKIEFHVPHRIQRKDGRTKMLTDPRDIYELIANMGARRKRACILAVIPGDVQDAVVKEVHKTLANQNDEPLKDRVIKMLDVFKTEYQVSQAMIEKRLGHTIDAISEPEMVTLKGIYRSLKDNMAKREDFFSTATAEQGAKAKSLEDALTDEGQLTIEELLSKVLEAKDLTEVQMLAQLAKSMKLSEAEMEAFDDAANRRFSDLEGAAGAQDAA